MSKTTMALSSSDIAPSQKVTNIVFITRSYRQDAGGMERLSWELLNEAKKNPRLNVAVLAHQSSRATAPLFVFTVIPRALSAARQADIVHLGDPMLAIVGWLVKVVHRKPIAVTVHGLDITYANPLYQMYLRLFFRNLDAYFPISRHVNGLLEKHHITGQRTVINPGIHDRHFDPSITRDQLTRLLTAHHAPRATTKVLLTVGRLVKRKGHAWFIANVLPNLPDTFIYVIAGQGPESETIIAAARRNNVADRVILLGKVSDADLKILYNTVDIFIQPNMKVEADAEGFGLVLLEAALCNRPVLAATIDGIPDAIQDGRNGTLLPPGDAQAWIETLTTVEAAPTTRHYTLEKYSWPQVAERFEIALRQLAQSRIARQT